jgi:hypothetical protein
VAWDEPHVSVGGLLVAGRGRKSKMILGKKACRRKATAGRKHNTCACKEGNNWKEEQHARMGGRPNDSRVRVLVMHCNG